MKPFTTLARARTSGGAELTLHEHDTHFFLRVNSQSLMTTKAAVSEMELAHLACERLRERPAVRVLIGGLGFGFTLRRVLELTVRDAIVEVAELLPEIVAWNREFLSGVNGKLLDDSRVRISIADVFQIITLAPAAHYDAILLDVDNGPMAMVQDGNARLYQPGGLAAMARVLKPGGRVTLWSAGPDPAFSRRLARAGFAVQVVNAKAHTRARRNAHTIFVADLVSTGRGSTALATPRGQSAGVAEGR